MFLIRTALAALVAATLVATPAAAAQESSQPSMKLDLIVPASGYADARVQPEGVCAVLPDGTASVTVSRRALVPDAGIDRPLRMTVGPYASTAEPLADGVAIREPVTLTSPQLAGATCFSFENPISPREAAGVAQAYKYFAQVVTLEAR